MTANPLASRRRVLARPRVIGAILVAASVSCGALPEPNVGSPTTGAAVDPDAADAATLDESSNPAAAEPDEGRQVLSELIVATGTLLAAGPAAQIRPLGEQFVGTGLQFAVDDFLGGIVSQASDGEVWWFPGEGGTSQLINGDGGGLLGVGLNEGTPVAYLLVEDQVRDPAAPAEDESTMAVSHRIETVGLVTGARSPFVTIEPGRTVLDFATGGARSAVILGDAACGGLLVFDQLGGVVPAELPDPVCPVPSLASFGEVALSADGSVLAFTMITYRPDGVEAGTSIVGLQMAPSGGSDAGVEVFRLEAGGAGDRLSSLDFDGQRLVFIRTSLNAETESGLMLVDLSEPTDAVLLGAPDALSVSFARGPLSFR